MTSSTDQAAEQQLEDEEICRLAKCPFCKNMETHQHYLHCTAQDITQLWQKLQKDVRTKLQPQEVYEGIITYLLKGLSSNIDQCNKQITCILANKLHKVIHQQTAIGWEQFRHDFLTTGWAALQQQYEKTTNKATTKDWDKIFSKTVIQYAFEVWKGRNKKLHGTTMKK